MISHPLHQQALKLSQQLSHLEKDFVVLLQQIESQRIFLKLGFSSMFRYATEALKLSESNAYSFISVARKAKEIPALQASIASGSVSVSKVKPVLAVLTAQNSEAWLEKVKSLPRVAVEKQIAAAHPQAQKREKLHYVRKEALRLHLELSENLVQKLKRAQDLSGAANWQETLGVLVEHYLKAKDPVALAARVAQRSAVRLAALNKKEEGEEKTEQRTCVKLEGNSKAKINKKPKFKRCQSHLRAGPLTLPGESRARRRRKALPAKVRHALNLRDGGRCQFRGPLGACGEVRFTEIHHLHPVAMGGKDHPSNLIRLCSRHHTLAHR